MKPTSIVLLGLLAGGALAMAQSPAPSHSGWSTSQKTDPAGTYTFTRFTLGGSFLGSPAPADRPALIVDCIPGGQGGRRKGKFLNAAVLVGATLKIDYVEPAEIRGVSYYPKVAVHYDIDGDTGQDNWAPGTDRVPAATPSDKTSASIPKGVIKRVLRGHSLSLSADDEHGAELRMQFDIADAKAVEAACNID